VFYSKEYLNFIKDSKKRKLDIVLISVKETIGHCYAKVGNIMLVNSNGEFTGVLGSPALQIKLQELSFELFESKKSITYENQPKDKTSGHGVSIYSLSSFFYEDGYEFLDDVLQRFGEVYSLLIFGSGAHVSSLVSMANLMGWKTTIIDMKRRDEYLNELDEVIILDKLEDILDMDLSSYNASVILSHSPKTDDTYLEALLQSNVEYIGILGNKKNMQKKREQFNLEDDKRFFAPVGFDIGGITHQSIALSICSQIEARKNGKI